MLSDNWEQKKRNNRSTEWELNVKFEITTIYFLKVLYVNYQSKHNTIIRIR
jgi:hypothetical protein